MAFTSLSGIDWSSISSVSGVLVADVLDFSGQEPPASSSYILDTYTGAGAAYSLRKLSAAYSGYAIQIYRDSDATTLDIGFDSNGDLDTASIESFCSGTTGRVVIWYDQSGNGYDLFFSSGERPVIYESGSILTLNGKPYIRNTSSFGLNNVSVDASDLVGVNESYSLIIGRVEGGTPNLSVLSDISSLSLTSGATYTDFNGFTVVAYNTSQTYTAGVQYIGEGLYVDSSNSPDIYIDDSLLSEAFGFPGAYTGSGTVSLYATGGLQELIIWPVDQSSNRSDIYSEVSTYYA